MRDHLITARGLYFEYPGGFRVLENIDLVISRGEVISVVGGSGAGKTTLLMILSGLLKPSRGDLEIKSSRIGILLQNYEDMLLFPTVDEEINDIAEAIARERSVSREEIIRELIERFGLRDLLRKKIYWLSAGERKRLVLAIVFSRDPEIVFLDEPLTDLDEVGREILIKEILEIKKRRGAVVIASNEIGFPREISDRICIINKGRIVSCLESNEVCLYKDLLYKNSVRVPRIDICC